MSRTALADLVVAPATTDADLLDLAAVRHAVDPDADRLVPDIQRL